MIRVAVAGLCILAGVLMLVRWIRAIVRLRRRLRADVELRTGAALDQLGEFWNVTRLTGETDIGYRRRILKRAKGGS